MHLDNILSYGKRRGSLKVKGLNVDIMRDNTN
jgi:hypothetical protein